MINNGLLSDPMTETFDVAWDVVMKDEGSFPDGTPRFDYSKPVSEDENVQRLHKLLSMATSVAEELELDQIESNIVAIQNELEYMFPGSEARYYGYSGADSDLDDAAKRQFQMDRSGY